MKTTLITGGSGLIGKRLTELLNQKNYKVRHLSRSKTAQKGAEVFEWDVEKGYIEEGALEGISTIIHMAGAGIADKRWTKERKKIIVSSRVNSAKLLEQKVREKKIPMDAFISASGIGYYGAATRQNVYRENDEPGADFIGVCCIMWEKAADNFKDIARVVKLRTAVVLSKKGGALDKIAKPIKFAVGSPLGNGKQWMPYIHLDDLCKMYIYAMENPELNGAYNAVASDHNSNAELTKKVAEVLNKPLWMPNVPAFAIKLMFGEMGNIVLEGSRASNDKIVETGFKFQYQPLKKALEAEL